MIDERKVFNELLKKQKLPLFKILTGIGGSVSNGNGRMNRWLGVYLMRRYYHFVLWTWAVGNGDDGSRCQ